jgi:trimeric autotransporter adhesin
MSDLNISQRILLFAIHQQGQKQGYIFMKASLRMLLLYWLCVSINAECFAQTEGKRIRPKTPNSIAIDSVGNLYIADSELSLISRVTPAGIITAIAGNGNAGFSGDGGRATSAKLYMPNGVALDSSGNLYVADTRNHRIRKVIPDGTIITVAGNGTAGFSGDGGKATSAQFCMPNGLAFDSSGNLYIADYGNNRLRRVTPEGIVATVAGNGTQGYGGDRGHAASAQLNHPNALAIDSAGNLYIADIENHLVRKVTPGGMIITAAGNGIKGYEGDGGNAVSAQLGSIIGLTADASGNLFIAERECRIRKVNRDGIISTVAGNGTCGYSGDGGKAISAQITAGSITLDAAGNLYIAESRGDYIRIITPSGVITSLRFQKK